MIDALFTQECKTTFNLGNIFFNKWPLGPNITSQYPSCTFDLRPNSEVNLLTCISLENSRKTIWAFWSSTFVLEIFRGIMSDLTESWKRCRCLPLVTIPTKTVFMNISSNELSQIGNSVYLWLRSNQEIKKVRFVEIERFSSFFCVTS